MKNQNVAAPEFRTLKTELLLLARSAVDCRKGNFDEWRK
jgi:hypothetical protein